MTRPKMSYGLKQGILKPEVAIPVYWYRWIINRLYRKDYNFTAIFAGDVGSGKTTTAVIHAHILTKGKGWAKRRFDETKIALSSKEFMDIVSDARRGEAVIWDEGGVGLDSRMWQKISNILISHTLMTYREKNLATFFCTPNPLFLDKRARLLTNTIVTCRRYGIKMTHTFMKFLEQDYIRNYTYTQSFMFKYAGRIYTMPRLDILRSALERFKRERAETYRAIKKKISEYKAKVMEKARKDAEEVENERFGITGVNYEEIMGLIRKEGEHFCKKDDKWNTNLIHTWLTKIKKVNVSFRDAGRIKDWLEKDDEMVDKEEYKKILSVRNNFGDDKRIKMLDY